MNNVSLIGNVTRDLELKQVGQTQNTRFTLAVTRRFKRDESDFINCIAWGKQAETLCQYVKKGQKIAIIGNIRTGSYEREGTTVYTTDVVVESFEFLGGGKQSDPIYTPNTNNKQNSLDDLEPVDDGDMPF